MKASLAILMTAVAWASLARAEIVEEETWYSAEGKVVKTVKRTLTDSDARPDSDWQPLWVLRERARGTKTPVRSSSPRRFYRGDSFGRGYYSPFASGYGYYTPRSCSSGGLGGFLRTGSGGTRWGAGYGGNGLHLLFTR